MISALPGGLIESVKDFFQNISLHAPVSVERTEGACFEFCKIVSNQSTCRSLQSFLLVRNFVMQPLQGGGLSSTSVHQAPSLTL